MFPVLHGKNGEDGSVQGLCQLAGIPVVGCGVLASALCMDKDRAHRLVQAAGIAVPHSVALTRDFDREALPARCAELGYPLFVKPGRAGSSYGVSKVRQAADLQKAIREAFQYDEQVLVEQSISGFEVGCAVIGNRTLRTGAVDEIELAGCSFFDFTEKYSLSTARIHVPARIPEEIAAEIQETAKKIYRILGCSGFARVDLFLTEEKQIVFHEVNTIPGFTPHSRFPRMMQAAGLRLEQVITQAIAESL